MSRLGTFKFFPMTVLDLGEHERGNVNRCLIDGEIGQGSFIAEFEKKWATYNGYIHGVACNSGTSAIYLALKAVGITPKDTVLCPNFTMTGGVWGVNHIGAKSEYYGSNYLEGAVNAPISEKYKAVIIVHIFGRRAYPEGWLTEKKKEFPNIFFIEDMAEAHGIKPEGDIACYSFYANKIITTGEGGMCLTNSEEIAQEIHSLANMYFDKERSMIHPKVGHNFRMTNMQAAIGSAQVDRIDKILEKREKIQKWYNKYLNEILPRRDVLWYYDIAVKNPQKAKIKLLRAGIESRFFFYPMSEQPWANGKLVTKRDDSLKWYKKGLLLPVHNNMQEIDVKDICSVVNAIFDS